jgi:hypothetical protein
MKLKFQNKNLSIIYHRTPFIKGNRINPPEGGDVVIEEIVDLDTDENLTNELKDNYKLINLINEA